MGHETQKRGTTSCGANSPAILAFLQKRGQGQKIFHFCNFFRGTHFYLRHEANNQFFLRSIFFADNNTLCQELIIFANV